MNRFLANQKYVAIGAFDMNVYDLTFVCYSTKTLPNHTARKYVLPVEEGNSRR